MEEYIKIALLVLVSIALSAVILTSIKVPAEGVGREILSSWSSETGLEDLNSSNALYRQVVALTLFLLVIGLTIISPKYRYYAAFFSIAVLAITAIIPQSRLVESVDWRLILFLAGSMTLAYILRSLGVFEFMLIELVHFTRGSFRALFAVLMFMAWLLAMILDEATSVVYIVMFILELGKLGVVNLAPLIILGVLATNTGSLALPVGNPIGVYLAFNAKLTVRDFLLKALPLSALLLVLLVGLSLVLFKRYFDECSARIRARALNIITVRARTELPYSRSKLYAGVFYLALFLALVVSVDWIAQSLSHFTGEPTDPHTLLAFIPYLVIALTPLTYEPEKLEKAILSGVEWPSLLFFVALFMLGDTLRYTGVAHKLAYAISQLTGLVEARILVVLLVFSATLSAFLDNLSVIVALLPVARVYSDVTRTTTYYWALLYGGVIGGNFTPIGSTANIVAWGLAERRRVKISWSLWFRPALVITLTQLLVALIYAAFVLK